MDPDLPAEPNSSQADAVAIRIFPNHERADIAMAKLNAHGIVCWKKADDAGGMLPNLSLAQGVQLLVARKDVADATALLNSVTAAEELERLEVVALTTPPPKETSYGLAWLALGLGLGIAGCLLYQKIEQHGTRIYDDHAPGGQLYESRIYRDGLLVEYRKDRNHDGKWDYWGHYDHSRLVQSEYDNNYDGKPDEWWTHSSDGTDTLEKDTDFNGTPDLFLTYKNRIVQTIDVKPNGSAFAIRHDIFQNGVLIEAWNVGDSNGKFREIIRFDPFGNPTRTNQWAAP